MKNSNFLGSHHHYGQTKQTTKKYGTTREYVNCDEWGSKDVFQISHDQNFTLLGLLVEISTAAAKQKCLIEAYSSTW